MEMIGNEFLDRFQHYIHQWWPARALLEKAIAKRFEVCCHFQTTCFYSMSYV
jgi:uncharacterized UPF0160 family protein